jgi:hypothetical protein
MNGRRVRLFQGKEDSSASGKLTTIGGNDLDRLAGLLAKYGRHRRAGTLLEGHDLESLLMVMSPEPGDSSPSEVSPPVPDQPVLPSHVAHDVCPLSSPITSTAMIVGKTDSPLGYRSLLSDHIAILEN